MDWMPRLKTARSTHHQGDQDGRSRRPSGRRRTTSHPAATAMTLGMVRKAIEGASRWRVTGAGHVEEVGEPGSAHQQDQLEDHHGGRGDEGQHHVGRPARPATGGTPPRGRRRGPSEGTAGAPPTAGRSGARRDGGGEHAVDPDAEEDGQGQVDLEEVAVEEALAVVEGDVVDEVGHRGEAAPGEEEADDEDDVPDPPAGRPRGRGGGGGPAGRTGP